MTAIRVEVSLGEFTFEPNALEIEDVIDIVRHKVRAEIVAEVKEVMAGYRAKIAEHLKPRLDYLLQEALQKADTLPDENLARALMEGLL